MSEGPPAEKKPKQEEVKTIMVERVNVYSTVVSVMFLLIFVLIFFCLTCVPSVKFLGFNSLKDTLDTSWVKHQKPKSLKRISSVFFIFQGNIV